MIMRIIGIIQKTEIKICLKNNASKLPSYFVYIFYYLIIARPTQPCEKSSLTKWILLIN